MRSHYKKRAKKFIKYVNVGIFKDRVKLRIKKLQNRFKQKKKFLVMKKNGRLLKKKRGLSKKKRLFSIGICLK
jgi:hypothetical protein